MPKHCGTENNFEDMEQHSNELIISNFALSVSRDEYPHESD